MHALRCNFQIVSKQERMNERGILPVLDEWQNNLLTVTFNTEEHNYMKKVKFTLKQTLKAQKGGAEALLFL